MSTLTRYLVAFAALATAFAIYSSAVALGVMYTVDHQVAAFMYDLWNGAALIPMEALAVLGGVEITSAVIIGLAVYIWRSGFRVEIWALLAFPAAVLLELAYKHIVLHPGPSSHFFRGEGPSIIDLLLPPQASENSFPSGHMTRTVLVYGLMAFVVNRLSDRRWVRWTVTVAATVVIMAMAFNRLYLGVHWESDVIGGFLLGSVGFLAATIWLERPGRL